MKEGPLRFLGQSRAVVTRQSEKESAAMTGTDPAVIAAGGEAARGPCDAPPVLRSHRPGFQLRTSLHRLGCGGILWSLLRRHASGHDRLLLRALHRIGRCAGIGRGDPRLSQGPRKKGRLNAASFLWSRLFARPCGALADPAEPRRKLQSDGFSLEVPSGPAFGQILTASPFSLMVSEII